ncbi:MAG: hypothetical protein ACQEWV_14450 [Bacillota bacterium]
MFQIWQSLRNVTSLYLKEYVTSNEVKKRKSKIGRGLMKAVYLLSLVFTLVGCSDYSSDYTKTEKITRIEEGMIYI